MQTLTNRTSILLALFVGASTQISQASAESENYIAPDFVAGHTLFSPPDQIWNLMAVTLPYAVKFPTAFAAVSDEKGGVILQAVSEDMTMDVAICNIGVPELTVNDKTVTVTCVPISVSAAKFPVDNNRIEVNVGTDGNEYSAALKVGGSISQEGRCPTKVIATLIPGVGSRLVCGLN